MKKRTTKHYVDNQKFLEEIKKHKIRVKQAEDAGQTPPAPSDYIGKCIMLIAEGLSSKPKFMNYSFRDEMVSAAIENCFLYFNNFDTDKFSNPFAYFTQVIYYSFLRSIRDEEKKRYVIYKKFQESVLESHDHNLFVDSEGTNLITMTMYDNINESIRRFEEKEARKKEKRKNVKEGLLKHFGEGDE